MQIYVCFCGIIVIQIYAIDCQFCWAAFDHKYSNHFVQKMVLSTEEKFPLSSAKTLNISVWQAFLLSSNHMLLFIDCLFAEESSSEQNALISALNKTVEEMKVAMQALNTTVQECKAVNKTEGMSTETRLVNWFIQIY